MNSWKQSLPCDGVREGGGSATKDPDIGVADRDAFLAQLYSGVTMRESFAAIASALAQQCTTDRTSLVRYNGHTSQLIASSIGSRIDRRTRQSRLLEQLATEACQKGTQIAFELGTGDASANAISETLDAYLDESGCREILVWPIESHEAQHCVACVVLERFRIHDASTSPIADRFALHRTATEAAIRQAIERDQGWWRALFETSSDRTSRVVRSIVGLGMMLLLVVAFAFPIDFALPAQGRLLATNSHHIFAPAEGIVSEILVTHGEQVQQGQPLLTVRSPALERLDQTLRSDLAKAQTRLDSLASLRASERDARVAIDEQSLKTEIEGLTKQIELLDAEKDRLTIKSPIDGRVDQWSLAESLQSRPVSHGQFLLDVLASDHRWDVQIEVPDAHIGYLLASRTDRGWACDFQLRSDPSAVFQIHLDRLDETAHLNAVGESVVSAAGTIESSDKASLRTGATVLAHVHCGQRSIAFVWLRGLIEWWRGGAW